MESYSCLRCNGLKVVDPAVLRWLIESIYRFDRVAMSKENQELLDSLLNLLDGVSDA